MKDKALAIATVVAAVITSVAATIGTPAVQRWIAGDPKKEPGPKPIVEPPQPSPVAQPSRGFGQWVDGYKPAVTYQAQSDGFVAVTIGGNSPPTGVDIFVGPTPDQVGKLLCTRVDGNFAGGICPVASGQWWIAVSRGANSGVTVRWLAIGR